MPQINRNIVRVGQNDTCYKSNLSICSRKCGQRCHDMKSSNIMTMKSWRSGSSFQERRSNLVSPRIRVAKGPPTLDSKGFTSRVKVMG